jgi:hypothetical protein
MTDKGKRRRETVARMLPKQWERRPYTLATELREVLQPLADQGRTIDTGAGDNRGDLWVTIDGVEYYITVQISKRQLQAEGHAT